MLSLVPERADNAVLHYSWNSVRGRNIQDEDDFRA